MRTVVHLSDLHFGRLNPATVPSLTRAIAAANPDVVVVSGDLTQRARTAEFQEARRFLDGLAVPKIVVPGNHDVPLHNLFARSVMPLAKYRRYITDDLAPFFADEEIAVVGINTARSLTFKNGRINRLQVTRGCACFQRYGPAVTRIVVTHHPFDVADAAGHGSVVGRARMAMAAFAECGVDMILSGHMHTSAVGNTALRYGTLAHAALLVQAGTATSTRQRAGQLNAYNIIRIDRPHVTVDRVTWNEGRGDFTVTMTTRFESTPQGWVRSGETVPAG